LLGYCYFYCQDFTNATLAYQRLVYLFPTTEEYKLYYAQAQYHASLYTEAMDTTSQIEDPFFQGKVGEVFKIMKYATFLIMFLISVTIGIAFLDIEVTSGHKIRG